MTRTATRAARAGVAMVTAGALVATGLSTGVAQAAFSGPVIRVAITNHDMYVDGPTTIPAGRVKIVLDGDDEYTEVDVVRLDRGYSFKNFRRDTLRAFEGNTKALRRSVRNTTFLGGIVSSEDKLRSAVLRLVKPGKRYFLFNFTNGPSDPVRLTVEESDRKRSLPDADARIVAKQSMRFGGDDVLPRGGNIRFRNKADETPHFLILQRVEEGTTRQDVLDSFQTQETPDFVLPASTATGVLSPGQALNFKLKVPAGHYAALCFFPDLEDATPHAFMGMVKMIDVV